MPLVGIEPATSTSERLQNHALKRVATGIGRLTYSAIEAEPLTLWRQNYFFLILAHPVYKM